MYINEKSWESQQEDAYKIQNAMEDFLNVYKTLAQKYHIVSLYVSSEAEPYLRSETYPIAKWLHEADKELRRLYLTFWDKRIVYDVDDEWEMSYEEESWKSGTEAYLNNSFVISIAFDEKWEKKVSEASLYSMEDDDEKTVM